MLCCVSPILYLGAHHLILWASDWVLKGRRCSLQDFNFGSGPTSGPVQQLKAAAAHKSDSRTDITAALASASAELVASGTATDISLWSCPFCRADCTSSSTAQAYQAHMAVQADHTLSQQDDSASAVQLHLDPDACGQLLQAQACSFAGWTSGRQQACLAALSGCCVLASVYLTNSAREQKEGPLRKLHIAAVRILHQ